MTFPAGNPGEEPGTHSGQREGGYEAPPIEEMPAGTFDVPPTYGAVPPTYGAPTYGGPPAGPTVPPGGYPPPPGYGAPPPEYGPPPGYGPPQPGWPAQPEQPNPYGVARAGTNPLALWSLAASVVGLLCGIGSIIGIVLGFMSLNQIKRTGQGGRAVAVAGIAIGITSAVVGLVGAYYFSR